MFGVGGLHNVVEELWILVYCIREKENVAKGVDVRNCDFQSRERGLVNFTMTAYRTKSTK